MELHLENMSHRIKTINTKIVSAKELALPVHTAGRETAREDILSNPCMLEELQFSMQNLSSFSAKVEHKFNKLLHELLTCASKSNHVLEYQWSLVLLAKDTMQFTVAIFMVFIFLTVIIKLDLGYFSRSLGYKELVGYFSRSLLHNKLVAKLA